jgi:ADP-ribose pyrophosphatase YjhB (NUDIX family)
MAKSAEKGPPVRRAVSVAIRPGDDRSGEVLIVLRPPDDPDLPNVWGLPAASLRESETAEAAVLRVGREKLGVELEGPELRASGARDREGYRLVMDLYEAGIARGEPSVPQPATHVTQYAAWRWAPPQTLRPGAERGSLCCRLFLGASGEGAGEPA